MAKILMFDFMAKDEDAGAVAQLDVSFDAGEPAEAIKFLTALSAFVVAYAAGRVVSIEDQSTQAKVVQLAPTPEPEAKPAPKPRAARASTPAPAAEPVPKAAELPPVTETVVAPLGSAQPAAIASAPASSPSPAPVAPTPAPRAAVQQVPAPKATPAPVRTGQPAAPSAASTPVTPPSAPAGPMPEALPLEQVPADLASAKSFRAALVLLQEKHGKKTVEELVEACYVFRNVPCIGRYLVPSPDPEMAIDVKIRRFLEVQGAAA